MIAQSMPRAPHLVFETWGPTYVLRYVSQHATQGGLP